ncbi:MaoC family dehydratase [Halobacillus karajensis]|uniref:(R)-specific enoyl-CoA hydratase n=1 Tax=Halobacillus karajensis TaxID=195088 RepID=A0A024P6G3_9BACI|nr:MaoC/PaaZ C-terminal domain-containing protein [Halobacillus karajensis]CDQ18276.1 (R)-specific enoyl-CoA hydratase [Halobacillus karajensis]CDQ24629.1 (R)-specific enoyl-CoA hydratase [Halobacillus karajensis]CDQ29124.1 (R)-specific enoyl-CoA hydratase [Halobacillus karajensis]
MLGKKRKLGKKINDLQTGEKFTKSFTIEDRDLLIYLGLTDDANPLYIQHDYASQTPFKRPVVPTVMIVGMVSSMISMHLPGAGSHITQQNLQYPKPLYHYAEVRFHLEIVDINKKDHYIQLEVQGYDGEGEEVVKGNLIVQPPYEPDSMNAISLENFY